MTAGMAAVGCVRSQTEVTTVSVPGVNIRTGPGGAKVAAPGVNIESR